MKHLTRILLVAVLASACAHTPPDSERVHAPHMEDAILPMARTALDSGQVETARRLYDRLLDVNPRSVEARMGLGDLALHAGETRAAAQWYLSVLEWAEQPNDRHAALLAHGRAALAAGELEAARESFTRLAEPGESAPRAAVAWGHNGIGLTLMLDGDLPGAAVALEQAVRLAPGDRRFQGNLDRLNAMLRQSNASEAAANDPAADPTTVSEAGDVPGGSSPSPQRSKPASESSNSVAASEDATGRPPSEAVANDPATVAEAGGVPGGSDPATVAEAGAVPGDSERGGVPGGSSLSPQNVAPVPESGDAAAESERATAGTASNFTDGGSPRLDSPELQESSGLLPEEPAPAYGKRNPKRLTPALASMAVAALGQDIAVGGSDLSALTLERDEFTDESVDATLWLFTGEKTAEREWLTWNCHHAGTQLDDTPYFRVQASAVRKPPRRQEIAAERVRIRVDKNPMRQWQSVGIVDWTDERHGFTGTGTTNVLCPLDLLDELAAGNRLIVQVGNLPTLSFDLGSAKPDILEFKSTCNRLYTDHGH